MTGHKKIVGLWRDSAANQEADCAAPAEAVAPETLAAPEVAAPAERDWLDMSSLNEAADADVAVPAWRDRPPPALPVQTRRASGRERLVTYGQIAGVELATKKKK